MSHFDTMIEAAQVKRDAAIQAAREEYRATVKQIRQLRETLEPRKSSLKGSPKPAVPLRSKVYDVIPKDSHFTIAEVAGWLDLEKADHQKIQTTLTRMIKRGEVKRVRRGRSRIPAVFAVADYGPPVNLYDGLTLTQSAELVLREIQRPMSAVALTVELLERGFTPSDEGTMLKSLRDAMRRKDQFSESAGLWSAS